jgi:hypothetical protein
MTITFLHQKQKSALSIPYNNGQELFTEKKSCFYVLNNSGSRFRWKSIRQLNSCLSYFVKYGTKFILKYCHKRLLQWPGWLRDYRSDTSMLRMPASPSFRVASPESIVSVELQNQVKSLRKNYFHLHYKSKELRHWEQMSDRQSSVQWLCNAAGMSGYHPASGDPKNSILM